LAFGAFARPNYYSLAEVNAVIADLLKRLNEERPIRRLGVTRRQLLAEIDRPVLKPLPDGPYVLGDWCARRVGIDYHVDIAAHYYNVPHRFARAEVEVGLSVRTVEIFLKGERIAAHIRNSGNRKHTTVAVHMPSSHRRYAGWTIERWQDAIAIGPATWALCEHTASRTGLARLSGHCPAGGALQRPTARSRSPVGHRDRRPHLRLDQIPPRQQC
jgi:transposase